MLDMNAIVGQKDIVLITLDTLRYDVAQEQLAQGKLPTLSRYISHWQQRHAPGSFTYASHQAIFAGFLPTPVHEPAHERLFALAFPGSATVGARTRVFQASNIVQGLAQSGYHTACIGGVGFFNPHTPLGRVLPGLFQHSVWNAQLGVGDPQSSHHQINEALRIIEAQASTQRLFLFINISAIHQPNHFYLPGARQDDKQSHGAALRYVDSQLPPLFEAFEARGGALYIICSDHGTTYGEAGYRGHRLAHECVWNVPYAEFLTPGALA